jgi:hypothetical protein
MKMPSGYWMRLRIVPTIPFATFFLSKKSTCAFSELALSATYKYETWVFRAGISIGATPRAGCDTTGEPGLIAPLEQAAENIANASRAGITFGRLPFLRSREPARYGMDVNAMLSRSLRMELNVFRFRQLLGLAFSLER